MLQFSAPMYPVGKMSDRKTTFSSGNPSGIFSGPTSAQGTRAYCACPPAYPPIMCVYPNNPDGEYPIIFSAIHAFGLVLSQSDQSCFWQKKQFPQAMVNGTTTRSPTRHFPWSTPEPTSITSPMNSCPVMSPCSIVGMKPLYTCESDPQIHVLVIRTIASRGFNIFGSGTVSTLIFSVPIQQTAFMTLSFSRQHVRRPNILLVCDVPDKPYAPPISLPSTSREAGPP